MKKYAKEKGEHMTKTKRKTGRWILLFILLILLYEAAGACLPFAFQKTVSDSYKKTVDVPAFYGSGPGRERAGIVETNMGALDTRLAMFREAKKNRSEEHTSELQSQR